jgi:hypothetical protein
MKKICGKTGTRAWWLIGVKSTSVIDPEMPDSETEAISRYPNSESLLIQWGVEVEGGGGS